MFRKRIFLFVPGLFIFIVVTSLYLGHEHLTRLTNIYLPIQLEAAEAEPSTSIPSSASIITSDPDFPFSSESKIPVTTPSTTSIRVDQTQGSSFTSIPTPTPSQAIIISNGTILDARRIAPFVTAILDPAATHPPRLQCPPLNNTRYDALGTEPDAQRTDVPQHIDYFFALNLRNCIDLLPRLLGSIVEAIRFLGPHRCALSIVEGNSPDGTADVIIALRPFLEDLGIHYIYNNSAIDPSKNDRIGKLVKLRNLVLGPLFKKEVNVSEETTVVFINDVAACTEDILELVLQRRNLNADMTCAMDWSFPGGADDPTFYDVWISRDGQGDTFFRIGENGNWERAWELFPDNPQTKARFEAHLPFQVFACWNGATAFIAAPLLEGLRFRMVNGTADECWQGEPQLFCKDMTFRGYDRIAVIPSVNLEYDNERARRLKMNKGYVTNLVQDIPENDNRIVWQDPPENVLCMPEFHRQSWRKWNETLH
ncbi:hypothetical protein FDECE_6856 [Fusarium decemcellulare]|nr:hypothetical protein FDECE_6856 [Fusarium decemcellulare]